MVAPQNTIAGDERETEKRGLNNHWRARGGPLTKDTHHISERSPLTKTITMIINALPTVNVRSFRIC
jgi:hypothetical protein